MFQSLEIIGLYFFYSYLHKVVASLLNLLSYAFLVCLFFSFSIFLNFELNECYKLQHYTCQGIEVSVSQVVFET